ncbi:MAG: 16S rRNA (guanine(527)-N(7))-methyltransferase RsmG [Bacteroidetes bacterium]|nr:16S rRNA (guanine(527)-N(7))-methyltransferase RsmG [Bacteroidota bacterium]MCY4206271.1 16S rRNA (guanine(527)-N(7))-methyltransferase RsmG [Bacteroidota bacterium]
MKHFQIQSGQQEKLRIYAELLQKYNRSLNLLSRRTTAEGFVDHIQECLAFTAYPFPEEVSIADWGTGGGLPAIPLAIMFPNVEVYAIDAIQKKILAVKAFKRELDLPNLHPWHGRAEQFAQAIKYSVSRATSSLSTLWKWHTHAATPGGALYCLKGGNLSAEQKALHSADPAVQITLMPVSQTSRFLVRVKLSSPLADKVQNEPLPPLESPVR